MKSVTLFPSLGLEVRVPVIAIINRKGGSGKSTLATHVAAWLSHAGHATMLGDVDRQQSTLLWLRLRQQRQVSGPAIVGWATDPQRVLRPPTGVSHVVLDTPGGLEGYDLTRVIAHADVVLVPVGESEFDLDAASQCLDELLGHPRVASGRTRVGVVGMRIDTGPRAERRLRQWMRERGAPLIGSVPTSRLYPGCAGRGLSVFDLPSGRVARQLQRWRPVTRWLAEQLDRKDEFDQRISRPVDLLPDRAAHPMRPVPPVRPVRPVRQAPTTVTGTWLHDGPGATTVAPWSTAGDIGPSHEGNHRLPVCGVPIERAAADCAADAGVTPAAMARHPDPRVAEGQADGPAHRASPRDRPTAAARPQPAPMQASRPAHAPHTLKAHHALPPPPEPLPRPGTGRAAPPHGHRTAGRDGWLGRLTGWLRGESARKPLGATAGPR